MFKLFRNSTVALLVGAAALMLTPEPEQARANDDGYWSGYWNWYDGSYRPYYHRQYRYRHYDYDDDDFGFRYNRYNYGYNRPYYRSYHYRYPRSYYYDGGHSLYGPHNSLQLGPLHFDWR